MADHDLLSEDDFFSQTGPQEKKPNKKENEEENASIEFEDEDLFKDIDDTIQRSIEDISVDKDEEISIDLLINDDEPVEEVLEEEATEPLEELGQDLEEESYEEEYEEPAQEEYAEEEYEEEQYEQEGYVEEEPEEKSYLDDYEDDKQEGVNYRPFVIGAAIIIGVAVVVFALYQFVFKGDGEEVAGADTKTEQVQTQTAQPSPEQIKRDRQYAEVAARTAVNLNTASSVASNASNNTKLSSVLIYGDEFLVEMFSNNRENLAKFNIDLRDKLNAAKVNLISTNERPGENGGVFGVFEIEKSASAGSGSGKINSPFKSKEEAKNWLTSLAASNQVKVQKIGFGSTAKKDIFTVSEIVANFSGSYDSCSKMVRAIGSSSKNIEIHKLNFTASDLRGFSKGKYQLKIILKVYV